MVIVTKYMKIPFWLYQNNLKQRTPAFRKSGKDIIANGFYHGDFVDKSLSVLILILLSPKSHDQFIYSA